MQSLRIAYRNVIRNRKRSLLLGGAIAFGFCIFTLVNGFTGGLLGTVSDNFADALGGHIYVTGSEVSAQSSEITLIRDTETLEASLNVIEDNIVSYNIRSSARASFIFGSREEALPLNGLDVDRERDFFGGLTLLGGDLGTFLNTPNAVLLPQKLIDDLGLEVGETVIVKTNTINAQQNVDDALIAGSIDGEEDFGFGGGTTGYAHLDFVNTLIDIAPGQYQTLNIYLSDLGVLEENTVALERELARNATTEPREPATAGPPDFAEVFGLGSLTTVDEDERWVGTKFSLSNLDDSLAGINALVGIMNSVALVIFIIIITIIGVGIMNSYRMVMIERIGEIGTMRAMGVQKSGVRNIFVFEALLIAVAGALIGLVVALVAMFAVGLLNFSGSDLSFFLDQGRLSFALSVLGVTGSVALICVTTVLAVFVPARAAANLQPADALRA